MSVKSKKQFGIWMDNHQATIVGKQNENAGFVVLATEKNASQGGNSNENAANNGLRTQQAKFFKQIAAQMQNAEELHVTGTGQAQEQFIKFMSETPQFKNTVALQSTSQKMSDEQLVAYITAKFN